MYGNFNTFSSNFWVGTLKSTMTVISMRRCVEHYTENSVCWNREWIFYQLFEIKLHVRCFLDYEKIRRRQRKKKEKVTIILNCCTDELKTNIIFKVSCCSLVFCITRGVKLSKSTIMFIIMVIFIRQTASRNLTATQPKVERGTALPLPWPYHMLAAVCRWSSTIPKVKNSLSVMG